MGKLPFGLNMACMAILGTSLGLAPALQCSAARGCRLTDLRVRSLVDAIHCIAEVEAIRQQSTDPLLTFCRASAPQRPGDRGDGAPPAAPAAAADGKVLTCHQFIALRVTSTL